LTDTGKGHRLVVLAVSLETASRQEPAGPVIPCDLGKASPEGEGWRAGREQVTPSGNLVTLSGPATYRVKVSAGWYRVDLEASGTGCGLTEVLLNGQPACAPWTLSSRCLSPEGTPFERVSVWGEAHDQGLDVTFQTAPGKGLWRHHVVHNRSLNLRYLAVTPEEPPPFVLRAGEVVTLGWQAPITDAFKSAQSPFSWQGDFAGAENTMIVGTGRAGFQVALPPGDYQVTLTAPSLRASNPQIGQVNPGPARLTFQDGKVYTLPQPEVGKISRLEVQTTVPDEGLAFSIEPAEGANNWGLAVVEIKKGGREQRG
jgi:hypothetical protein